MIRTKQFYLFVIAILVAAITQIGCGTAANSAPANANDQPTVVDVTTEAAVIKPIPTYVEATGNLASDAQTDIAPNVAGKIATNETSAVYRSDTAATPLHPA